MKIGIIGAMELEINTLKKELNDIKTTTIGSFAFHEGKIHGVSVVVLLSGIGKVSASVGTTLLIEHFHPDMIINTGTAGGLGTSSVHDIILANEVRHHDVDVTAFGYEIGQQAQMPAAYFPDDKWFQLAKSVAEKHSNQLHCGLVVSGDSFISDPKRLQQIENTFPEAKAVEMEAAAIAQTCYLLKTPFIMLRAISDKAGEGNASSYEKFVVEAGKLSAEINIDIIKNIGN
ncbi:5'-methylthioadenosine/adenosylhomocysteine nucleosidase [Capnocytophaga felis]|uniref:5'-methylthioadenosine/S-adenosylhomocysteine nucleosidase n=1 Tax=Capnocytophaga felis TaxID=2267611 RepID=A0A5M4B7D0_9FLAO|nr:5'-methylthioadenosine/adenosylhomocysteine nucleosidase [Capnocytophaga felis]GET45162.1 5'-methylthioadenosine/S-adenosylhomocysteine nucleosidase [Capnocytophaga felis]GET47674.1 5'-methylthioadenosine/S-adenosylhomocysteine nucleosidase [Capnocytophaga felis]